MTVDKLFVYGIFLSSDMRQSYGMRNPRYATVKDYVTYGNQIVTAYKQEGAGLALTGLVVAIDPSEWKGLDQLESGYNRIEVITTDGEPAYMYVGKTDL